MNRFSDIEERMRRRFCNRREAGGCSPYGCYTLRTVGTLSSWHFRAAAFRLPMRLRSPSAHPPAQVEHLTERESKELNRREHLYRDSRPFPKLEGTVIFIDDGLATRDSMIVAVQALQ